MSTSARRNSTYIPSQPFTPAFDTYGYSPYVDEPRAISRRDRSNTLPADFDDRRSSTSSHRHSSTSGRRHSTRPRNHEYHRSRAVEDYKKKNDDDDGWDTDYDPRDKYYLSGDESDRHHHSHRRSSHDDHHKHHSSSHRDRDLSPHSSRRSSHAPSRPSHARRTSSSAGGSSRPSRPRATRAVSSYRGRSARYPPSSSRSKGSNNNNALVSFPWEQAAKAAAKAGAITAIKVSHTQGSLLDKGAKVVSTALAVSNFLSQKGIY